MNIDIRPDGDGFLASVVGCEDYLFAFGSNEREAEQGLFDVIDMTLDIHNQQIQKETMYRQFLTQRLRAYALQV